MSKCTYNNLNCTEKDSYIKEASVQFSTDTVLCCNKSDSNTYSNKEPNAAAIKKTAFWEVVYDREDGNVYVCSSCGRSALNDYRSRSTASKFCPHCGKFMANHQPEDDQ